MNLFEKLKEVVPMGFEVKFSGVFNNEVNSKKYGEQVNITNKAKDDRCDGK